MKNFAKSYLALMITTSSVVLAPLGFAQAPHTPTIASISICSPTGTGGQGSCPGGTSDSLQIVLGPNGASINASNLGVGPAPDEHSSVFAPGALGANSEYLFFLATPLGGNLGLGVSVLSGGSGPNKNGQWTLNLPKADGYGSYASGFGQVFTNPIRNSLCPTVPDGNPAHQDQTFDLNYAASGSVVKDPTGSPGSFLMIYEGTNNCIANAGGPLISNGDSYISLAVATSLDYGKTWPTYRGTATYPFDPLPGTNGTTGPNAPTGALGKNVCMGNDCTTTPPASYGRYPIATKSTSLASFMAAAKPLTSNFGYQEISGFVDDIAGGSAPYVYALSGAVQAARAQLNGGSAPLSFLKWDGKAFDSPGIGGADVSVLPNGPFQNCEAPAQNQYGSSISYVETTQQYLLTFLCVSVGDPALGQGSGGTLGGSWFYSTSYDLSDPTQWTLPQEITGSWSAFDQSGGCLSWNGYYPTFMSLGERPAHLSTTGYVFSLWGCQGAGGSGGSPPKRQMAARAFTMTLTQPCTYSFNSDGQSLPASGGSIVVNVTALSNCPWSVGQLPSWITLVGSGSGTGGGSVTFSVSPNAGGDQSASVSIGGTLFTIEQQASSIPGLLFSGSMPHIAAEGGWTTAFTLVNKVAGSTQARLSLFGDPSDSSGNGPLTVPLTFPQQAAAPGPLLAASFDRTLSSNASLIIDTAGPQTSPVLTGSAQLAATGAVDGFAIFRQISTAQEAVVPLETRNASSYVLAFDNTSGVAMGVAVANVSAQLANIGVVIRDDAGNQIGPLGATIALAGGGHKSFVLSDPATGGFSVTANIRGTIEFDAPPSGQISVLGIRSTPPNHALTTIPALASVGTGGGSIAHIASGNGWQTTFVLVNTGTSAAQIHLKFFADVTGTPLSLPLSFPQPGRGAATTASSVDQTLAAGATLLVQSAAPLSNPAPTLGSAQLTTNGNVGGFVIFRFNPSGQEAVVPLETRNANAYILAFDNTGGKATGIAINSVSSQTMNVPVVVRDDTGTQIIPTDTLTLAANAHLSFVLGNQPNNKYPATANIRGTVEFDTPLGGQISVVGIRANGQAFTTLPALVK